MPNPRNSQQNISSPERLAEAQRLIAYLRELDSRETPGSKRTRQNVINFVSKRINDPKPPSEVKLYRYRMTWNNFNKSVIPLIRTTKRECTKQFAVTGAWRVNYEH